MKFQSKRFSTRPNATSSAGLSKWPMKIMNSREGKKKRKSAAEKDF